MGRRFIRVPMGIPTRADIARRLRTLFGGITIRVFAVILLAILPFVGFRALDLFQSRQQFIELAGNKALDLARRGAELYSAPIVEAQTLLQVVSQVPQVVAGSSQSCASFLERAGRDRPWVKGFWVIDGDGRVICSTVPQAVGLDLSGRDYVQKALATRQFTVTDFMLAELSGEPTTMAALPVEDGEGRARLFGVTLNLNWFSRLAAEVGSENNVRVLLFDGQGTLLARYPAKPEWIGKNFRGFPLVSHMRATGLKRGWTEIDSPIGPAQIYGFLEIPGTPARIAIGFDRPKVLAGISTEIAKAVVALLLTALLAALTSMFLARRIVRPLQVLTAGAKGARNSSSVTLPRV
jgi:hypothetical protein